MPKIIALLTNITLIVMGSLTITVLASVKVITNHFLKKSGYYPKKARQTYQQVKTDLNQAATDLNEIRMQLEDIAPYLQNMEFLKYAREEGHEAE